MMVCNRFTVVFIAAAASVCGLLKTPATTPPNSTTDGATGNAQQFSVDQVQELFAAFVETQFPAKRERLAVEALVDWAVAESEVEISGEQPNFEEDAADFETVVSRVANSLEATMAAEADAEKDKYSAPRGAANPSSPEDIEAWIQQKKASRDSYERVAEAFWSFVEFSRLVPHATQGSSSATFSAPQAESTDPATAVVPGTPGGQHFYRPAAGDSEVIIFLNVSPMTLLNRICQGQRVACAEVFQVSLYTAIQAVVNDAAFTQDRVKMGNVGMRGSGVQQAVLIYGDGDLRLADALELVLEDVQFCNADPSRPICRTLTGQTLVENNVTPKVLTKRVVG
ncbi:conserved hypothetical protein [Neospora caninum Liverpool]|uniref:Transmembrane protein n=1 Tax=Neospora caninum (strain Liverpool) TaxID=572307 RepID=F0VL35_NEOCL|nr:conserved hypothetical protein [Neospora caninum Liverpool]CBZ54787.1 conserved hypothetical protein [Neospora caninum Liverpool]CEL69504.1 TPA: hypothetical protein BN1204_052130 [Neospora caninum Liverpool]|eukprot:XP_003884815.1 conserved hypothetical protein [Neospora caninum Liverpool]